MSAGWSRSAAGEQPPQFPATRGNPDGRDKLAERLGKRARRPACGRPGGGERRGERRVDLVNVESSGADLTRIDVIAEDLREVGNRARVVGVTRVGGRRYQLIGVCPATILGRAVAPAVGAHRSLRPVPPCGDSFELDDMLPVIAEVVLVKQLVTHVGQHLVESYLFLGDPDLALLYLVGPCWLIRLGGEGEVESGEVA